MCSMIDSGEKGHKLPEQILFNSLVLYLRLMWSKCWTESLSRFTLHVCICTDSPEPSVLDNAIIRCPYMMTCIGFRMCYIGQCSVV